MFFSFFLCLASISQVFIAKVKSIEKNKWIKNFSLKNWNNPKRFLTNVATAQNTLQDKFKGMWQTDRKSTSNIILIWIQKQDQGKHTRRIIPCQSKKGDFIIKERKKQIRNIFPSHIKPNVTYTVKKIVSPLLIKSKSKFEHNYDVIYHGKCPEIHCVEK